MALLEMILPALLGTGIGSLISGGTKSKETGGGWQAIPQSGSQQRMEQLLENLARQKVTFEPRKVAPLTKAGKGVVDIGTRTVEKGIPGLNEAIEELRRIMTGDVETVPGLEGLFQRVREMGGELLGSTKRGLAMKGHLPSESTRGEKIMGRTWQDIQNELVTAAFPFFLPGLEAKYAAPGRLADLATQAVTTPMAVGAAAEEMQGTKLQQILDAAFEAKRSTKEFPYTAPAGIAANVLGRESYAYQPPYRQPSTFSQVAPLIGQLGAAALLRGGKTAQQKWIEDSSLWS